MTKEERLAIYQELLEYYQKTDHRYCSGFCYLITYHLYRAVNFKRELIELYAQKPSNNETGTWYWWPRNDYGKAMRIQALEKAIALCQNS